MTQHTHAEDPHRACAGCAMERARWLERSADGDPSTWADEPEARGILDTLGHPGAHAFATLLRACGHEVVAVIPASEADERIVAGMLKRRPRSGVRRAL